MRHIAQRDGLLLVEVLEQALDAYEEVMTLPQSGRLDVGEQPQGLPDARAQRLFEVTVFIPALGIELFLVAALMAHVLFVTSHRRYGIISRPEGFAVAMALATPKLPSHSNRGCPLEGTDDFGHRICSRSA